MGEAISPYEDSEDWTGYEEIPVAHAKIQDSRNYSSILKIDLNIGGKYFLAKKTRLKHSKKRYC